MIPVIRVRPKPRKADLLRAIAGLHMIRAMQCVAPEDLARMAPEYASMASGRRLKEPETRAFWHLLEVERCRDRLADLRRSQ